MADDGALIGGLLLGLGNDHDSALIGTLLLGRFGPFAGFVAPEYLEPGSKEERAGFAALARLLRSEKELNGAIREILADLFEPGTNNEPRRLVFAYRARGRKGQHPSVEISIAQEIAAQLVVGSQLKKAVSIVSEMFGVSERTVTRAWKKYKGSALRHMTLKMSK